MVRVELHQIHEGGRPWGGVPKLGGWLQGAISTIPIDPKNGGQNLVRFGLRALVSEIGSLEVGRASTSLTRDVTGAAMTRWCRHCHSDVIPCSRFRGGVDFGGGSRNLVGGSRNRNGRGNQTLDSGPKIRSVFRSEPPFPRYEPLKFGEVRRASDLASECCQRGGRGVPRLLEGSRRWAELRGSFQPAAWR